MRCPRCSQENDRVLDSRSFRKGTVIRRRRECLNCHHRYTTYEEIYYDNINVLKRDGRQESFDRQKLETSIRRACGKRPITEEQISMMLEDVIKALGSHASVKSATIAEKVMDELHKTDEVAYIRFASVYREFTDKAQFVDAVSEM